MIVDNCNECAKVYKCRHSHIFPRKFNEKCPFGWIDICTHDNDRFSRARLIKHEHFKYKFIVFGLVMFIFIL